jgi:hypothetical protein
VKSRSPRERCKTFPFQFRLIASTPRCVGLGDTNVNQSRFAEEMTDYAYYKATKKSQESLKKVLTNPTECGTIKMFQERNKQIKHGS